MPVFVPYNTDEGDAPIVRLNVEFAPASTSRHRSCPFQRRLKPIERYSIEVKPFHLQHNPISSLTSVDNRYDR